MNRKETMIFLNRNSIGQFMSRKRVILIIVLWLILALVVISSLLAALTYGFVAINRWSYKTEIVSPIKHWIEFQPVFQARKPQEILKPVIVESKEGREVEKELTYEEKVAVINKVAEFPKQVLKFWTLESSQGAYNTDPTALHMICKSYGMTNEFGYDPFGKATGSRCFETFEASVRAVDTRLGELLSEYTLDEAICIYNTGKSDSCVYLWNYKRLK